MHDKLYLIDFVFDFDLNTSANVCRKIIAEHHTNYSMIGNEREHKSDCGYSHDNCFSNCESPVIQDIEPNDHEINNPDSDRVIFLSFTNLICTPQHVRRLFLQFGFIERVFIIRPQRA